MEFISNNEPKLVKADEKTKKYTLCSKMMSKAVDVASSTSYTARAILQELCCKS